MDKSDYIFGVRPIVEAIDAGNDINKVLIKRGLNGEGFQELFSKLRELDVPCQFVPEEKLNCVTMKNHQGIIAFISPVKYSDIDFVVSQAYETGKIPLIIVLDRITDVRNFGAIARSAECMGVDAIVIGKKGGVSITGDALKTSAGALNRIPVCRTDSIELIIIELKNNGLVIIGCTEKGNKQPKNIDFSCPTAIVMGSEEDGISKGVLELCDEKVMISMTGHTASLNVSVAAGMILYEARRQRDN